MSIAIATIPSAPPKGLTGSFSELQDECAGFGQFVEELLKQLDTLRAEVDTKSRELDEQRAQLAASAEQLRQEREWLAESHTYEKDKADLIEQLQYQRDQLEEEFERVRRQTAEMSNMLDQQKQEIAEERAEWSGELKSMRLLLERHAESVAVAERRPEQDSEALNAGSGELKDRQSSRPSEDPVVNSVMAQFARLQKDAHQRRKRK